MATIPVLGLVIAVMRSFRGPALFPLPLLAVVYVDLFRGIPLILQRTREFLTRVIEAGRLSPLTTPDRRRSRRGPAAPRPPPP